MYEQGEIKISLVYLNTSLDTIAIKSLFVILQLEPLLCEKPSAAGTPPFLFLSSPRKDMMENTVGEDFFLNVQSSANNPSTFKHTHRDLIGSHFYMITILRPSICRKNGLD